MKFLLAILLIMGLAFAGEYFTHAWWALAVAAALVCLLLQLRPGKGFLAGFLAIALLWAGVSLRADVANEHILSDRLAKLFTLPNRFLFLTVVAVLGGLVGGVAGWAGASLGRLRR